MGKMVVEQVTRRMTITAPGNSGEFAQITLSGFRGQILFQGDRGRLVFQADCLNVETEVSFRVSASKQAGGGWRPWIHCPDCQRRRRRLFVIGDRLACRLCFSLSYMSSQLAHRHERIAVRIEKAGGLRHASDRDLSKLLRLVQLERELEGLQKRTRKSR